GLFQAQGGMMAVTGIPEGQPGAGPLKAGAGPPRLHYRPKNAPPLPSALVALGALMHRTRTGEGQFIDIALLDTSVAMVSHIMQDYLISGVAPPRLGNGGNGGGAGGFIKCSGRVISIF